jgi:hypothetical protein
MAPRPSPKLWLILGALGVALYACDRSDRNATPKPGTLSPGAPAGAFLTANPDPAGIRADPAATTIQWNTGDGAEGQIFVAVDGGSEELFARGPSGSQSATWIAGRSRYRFTLYAAPNKRPIASVTVARR